MILGQVKYQDMEENRECFELIAVMQDKGINSCDQISKAIDIINEHASDLSIAIKIIKETLITETSLPKVLLDLNMALEKLTTKQADELLLRIFSYINKQAELDDLLYSLDLMYRQSQQIEDGYAIHLSRFKLIREAVEGFYAKDLHDGDTPKIKLTS